MSFLKKSAFLLMFLGVLSLLATPLWAQFNSSNDTAMPTFTYVPTNQSDGTLDSNTIATQGNLNALQQEVLQMFIAGITVMTQPGAIENFSPDNPQLAIFSSVISGFQNRDQDQIVQALINLGIPSGNTESME